MDCERNFSRDRQTDRRAKNALSAFFEKKRKNSSSRVSGRYFSQNMQHTRRFAIGETLHRWLPALLGSCTEYRRLITGKSGHPHSLLFRAFCTTASTLLFRSRARRSRAACRMYVSRVTLFRICSFVAYFARINERHFRGKIYMTHGYWIIPSRRGRSLRDLRSARVENAISCGREN